MDKIPKAWHVFKNVNCIVSLKSIKLSRNSVFLQYCLYCWFLVSLETSVEDSRECHWKTTWGQRMESDMKPSLLQSISVLLECISAPSRASEQIQIQIKLGPGLGQQDTQCPQGSLLQGSQRIVSTLRILAGPVRRNSAFVFFTLV